MNDSKPSVGLRPINKPESIAVLLADRVQNAPEKVFLFSEADGRRFSYARFAASVERAAAMLQSHGIKKGDVVSLLLPNSAEYIIAYFACWKLGAIAGPVNSLLKDDETQFVMHNSEAKAVLVASELRERIENIKDELPHLKSVITFDDESEATSGYAGRWPASTPEACVPT